MPALFSHRRLLPLVTLFLASALNSSLAVSADHEIGTTTVRNNLKMITGAGGNILVHEGPESLLLIDGGAPEYTSQLMNLLAEEFGNKPVTVLVNTHWHLNQTGSNEVFSGAGVPIIAHENTRRWMTTRIEQQWNGPVYEPREEAALPTKTFYVEDGLNHADAQIRLIHTPRAHTDGDLIAVFPADNVIAAGGTAYAGMYPVLDTSTNGWIGEMLDATRTLISLSDDETLIVPSDGGILRKADLEKQEEMLATLLKRFQDYSRQGYGSEEMLREGIASEYVEDWGDPTVFIRTAWDGLWDHMRGLGAF